MNLLDIIGFAVILFTLLTFMPRRFWFVEVFNNIHHWTLLATVVVTAIYLVKRQWIRSVLWGVSAIIFIFIHGSLFLPAPNGVPGSRTDGKQEYRQLRVMCYNTFVRPNTDRMAQVEMIRQVDADIVTLQEMSVYCEQIYERELSELYPYRIMDPSLTKGTGILSKYPIIESEILDGALNQAKAVIDMDGVEIAVVSTHPAPSLRPNGMFYQSRVKNVIAKLLGVVSEGRPTILAGDFNMTDQSSDYQDFMKAGLHDAFREMGWGFGCTWPSKNPVVNWLPRMVRIDMILYTDNFTVESVRVGDPASSDHSPVIAELVFNVRNIELQERS